MNNDTVKQAFPGYEAEQKRIIRQEQEHTWKKRPKPRYNAWRATKNAQNPHVRSGLLNQWLLPLITGGTFF